MSDFENIEDNELNEWQTLKNHEDYEININYPYQIRKKTNKRIVKESINGHGYIQINLNKKVYEKHRLIAIQFISNPDNLPQVDHKNRIKTDNRIENLRFVNSSQNQLNKAKYKNNHPDYLDSLKPEAIEVKNYGNHYFEGLYFQDNKFYQFNGNQYRELTISKKENGFEYVRPRDINGKRRNVYYNKFKRDYNN